MSQYPVLKPWINGQYLSNQTCDTVPLINPANGQSTGALSVATAATVDHAVAAARSALDQGWRTMAPMARAGVLKAVAAQLEAAAPQLAQADCLDMGKPVSAGQFEAGVIAAGFFRYYAEAIDKRSMGSIAATDNGVFEAQVRRPRGVIATIIPWNFPVVNLAMKVAPMLAAGNSVVLKPSELASRSALLIGELAETAGLPSGVLNIVPGDGTTGDLLARHPGIDMLAFTGSTRTGRSLMRAVGDSSLKPVLLECGGKSPEVVFADMGPDQLSAIAGAIVNGAMANQGQVCVMRSRLYVEDAIYPALIELIQQQLSAIQPADPASASTQFGPLASRRQQLSVEAFIAQAERDGARLLLDGRGALANSGGCYVGPTLIETDDNQLDIVQQEVFGPVIAVQRFVGEEQAIALANGTQYGLAATIWTRDLGRAHRVSAAIDAGMTKVMAAPVQRMGAGFAHSAEACKQSGFGIEGGLGALDSFSRLHAVEFHFADDH